MKAILRLTTIIFFTTLMVGCTPKITVKTLYPSNTHSEKIDTIAIEEFYEDDVNQANAIEEAIANQRIEGKNVFKISNFNNVDAVITGEVLESSLKYNPYYEKRINFNRCVAYNYDKNKKKTSCKRYRHTWVPCEDREYSVTTKIRVLQPNTQTILFTKTYSKSRNTSHCFDYRYDYHPHYLYYPRVSYSRNKHETNSNLAKSIAKEFIKDVSPHYVYFTLEIIDELEKKDFGISEKDEEKFELAVSLLEKRNINYSEEILLNLNKTFKGKSWEVLYNLAVIQEAKNNLSNAKEYYQKAYEYAIEADDKILINRAIFRIKRNLEEKIKAKSQLS